jgi:hypothetical protein
MPEFALVVAVVPPPGFGVSKQCLAMELARAGPFRDLVAEWSTDGDTDSIRVSGQVAAPDAFIAARLIDEALPWALRSCHVARDAPVVELALTRLPNS